MISIGSPASRPGACSPGSLATRRPAWCTWPGGENNGLGGLRHGPPQPLRPAPAPGPRSRQCRRADLPLVRGAACRLQRMKAVHGFLDAAAQVVKAYPEARFIVVGGTLFGLEESLPFNSVSRPTG